MKTTKKPGSLKATWKAMGAQINDLADHIKLVIGYDALRFCIWLAPRCPIPFCWRHWGIALMSIGQFICSKIEGVERRVNLVREVKGLEEI